jgi:hypothetical protein
MTDELQELHEHAEHAQHRPDLAPVSLTMAVLAVLVAVATLLGHRAHTEEVVLQAKASDQWAYYQAKNIRQHEDELFADFSSVAVAKDTATMDKFRDKTTSMKKETFRTRLANSNGKSPWKEIAPIATIWPKSSWRSAWSSLPLHCFQGNAFSGTSEFCSAQSDWFWRSPAL